MNPNEEKEIVRWNSQFSDNIQIRLILTEDERSRNFSQFCEDLSRLAPRILVGSSLRLEPTKRRIVGSSLRLEPTKRLEPTTDESESIPAIRIVGSSLRLEPTKRLEPTSFGKETLHFMSYQAIPLGTELSPFLEALTLFNHKSPEIPDYIRQYLDKIRMPVELTLYVSQHCPFCPATVRQLLPLAAANEFIHLTVRDGFLFPEMAKSDNIQSAPTLLLDKNFRWTGSINLKELLEVIVNRDPAQLGASSLEAMLKEGNASQVAKMMTDSGKIFPAFFDLLSNEKWSVRLGAMTVMEEIAENHRELAAQVIMPMWERFHHAKDQVKGDILYIFGEAGNNETISVLKTVLNGDYHSEVKEAAKEAIEKINKCS